VQVNLQPLRRVAAARQIFSIDDPPGHACRVICIKPVPAITSTASL
jgi:hypothetical protein